MMSQWLAQIAAVVRLEMRKTFLARRGLWVYLLAFAPVVLFLAHSIYAPRERTRLADIAATHPVSKAALESLHPGLTREEVVGLLGEPYARNSARRRVNENRGLERDVFRYTDGEQDIRLRFVNGELMQINRTRAGSVSQDTLVFSAMFQFYFLRLAIFFGCVGIFTNLFRGELLDKSLHFYLLAPIRREVLLAGKYIAGLAATTVIFVSSTGLQLLIMLWPHDAKTVGEYLQGQGWAHIAAYLGVTALACLGYGSIFLAAGLLFRNPVVPAAIVLIWESANLFLPAALKKISLIFYLQSLCPIPAEPDNLPPPLRLLISGTTPATTDWAVTGVVILTLLVLLMAGLQARKLEINYSTE